jgi:hypothetical protein
MKKEGVPKMTAFGTPYFYHQFQHLAIKRLFFFLMGLFLSYRSDVMSYFLLLRIAVE